MFRILTFTTLIALPFISTAYADNMTEVRKAQAALLSAEQTTDQEVIPVVTEIKQKKQQSQESMNIAASARQKLEKAREDFVKAFEQLNAQEKATFIQELSSRPRSELLIYDIEPISNQIPRIAEIRQEQAIQLNEKRTGRALPDLDNPSPVSTGVVTIDVENTTEINGGNFANNHFSLTFDDGPSARTTPVILNALERVGAKVNFFQLGNMIEKLGNNMAAFETNMIKQGHRLENHSWDHPQMTHLSLDDARGQIEDTYAILEDALSAMNYHSSLFRFPYGDRNAALKNMLREMNVTSVMWNIDTLDWKYKDPETIVNLATDQMDSQGRGIILMHDIHPQTTLAVPHILQELANRNATVVQLRVK